MKVCLANDSFPPLIDGVANTVINYADIITKKYGSAIVATPEYPKSNDSDFPFEIVRYKSFNVGKSIGYRAGYPFSISAMNRLTSFEPEIIHSHCPMMSAYLCRELRSLTKAPLIFTYHTKFDVDISRAIKLEILQEKAISLVINNIEACDDVWVVSEGAGENLKSLGFKGTYTVMPNGVDMPKAPVNEKLLTEIKQKYGLLEISAPIFLSVGRMKWYKGHKITIDALRKLRSSGKNFKMLFVGDGSDKKDIEEYAKECGIYDMCVFTGAIHDREILRTLYFCGDIFVFPSTYDTNGIVVREAAACSLGSILIKGSCAAEGVTDGRNGILTDENSDSLAKALSAVCDNVGMARLIGQNAADELFISWEQAVEKAVARYGYVMDNIRCGHLNREHVSFDKRIDTLAAFYKGMAKLKSVNDDFPDINNTNRRRKK